MKRTTHLMIAAAFAFCSLAANAQEVASNDEPAAKPEAPVQANKEVTITIKNTCEKGVAVFAGPKEEIRDPKLNTYGGLSTNKVYIKENDVVCLMTSEKKPIACTLVKPGMTTVEVNTSATGVTGR